MQGSVTAREQRRAYAAWLSCCFFWGTTYLAIRIGVHGAHAMPPWLFAGARFLLAGGILAAGMRLRGHALPEGADWLRLCGIGLALLGVGNGVVVWASQWLPSGLVALIISTAPFWMSGVEALLPGGERLTRRVVAGLVLGFGGLAFLLAPKLTGTRLDPRLLAGFLALELGCASWAAGSLFSRRQPARVKPLMGAAIQMLAAGVALTLLGTLAGEWPRFRLDPVPLLALAYLVTFGSIVGYSSYIYALQKLPVATVSLYAYVNPIIAVLLGWAVLREPLGWREWTAMGIILSGVALVRSGGRKEKSPERPPLTLRGGRNP